jgi:hypothetical protein
MTAGGDFVITPALMLGMEDIILDRIAFGGVKELEELYFRVMYDEDMQIIQGFAGNLTATMLKRWMIIWLTLVIFCALSIIP